MKTFNRVICGFACAATLCSFSLFAADTVEDSTSKTSFPSQIKVQHDGQEYVMDATGTATRSKFFVNVYGMAHYMQNPTKGPKEAVFAEILDGRNAKGFQQEWVHDADLQRVRDGYKESFKKILGENDYNTLKPQLENLLSFYKENVKVGDKHAFYWFPDGTLEMIINGQTVGTIKDPVFAKAFWSMWVGPKSVVSRNKLISRLTSNNK